MRIIVRLAVLFFLSVTFLIGGVVLLYVGQVVRFEDVYAAMYNLYYGDAMLRMNVAIVTIVGLIMSLITYSIIIGRQQKEQTIAFDNPTGRVSVSLRAMEDLVRRLVVKEQGVKEVRTSTIRAGKKGLVVDTKLILRTDVNIPEMTSKLQEIVKHKIQDTIGIEENIIVKMHVMKIAVDQDIKAKRGKEKDKKDEKEPSTEPTLPFQGYRA